MTIFIQANSFFYQEHLDDLRKTCKRVLGRYNGMIKRRKHKRLAEIRDERLEVKRSTMTVTELSQKTEECEEFEFDTRVGFIKYVYM